MKNYKIGAIGEIIILVVAIFAFAYMIGEADRVELSANRENNSLEILFKILRGLVFNERGIVSAMEESDLEKGAYTCIKSKDGKICQEYLASECDSKCGSTCLPTSRKNVAECRLGTCYDSSEGTCQVMSPKKQCEDFGGKWFNDENGNIGECKKGCCVIGDDATFVTQQQCNKQISLLGKSGEFKQDVQGELECLMLSKAQEEGACVLANGDENSCVFGTKQECLQKGGEFSSGFLCSYPDLKTNCKAQQTVGCVEGKDEVYWFDSCGNRENIYNADKIKSLNGNKILAKAESCELGNGVANQGTCGNCNYLLGSKCGLKTGEEKLADSSLDYVCKDISCKDENGNRRENGESWCEYQGHIGLERDNKGKPLRSTDTAGSRHFRKVCINGEIKTEPCADYRNEICVESKQDIGNGKQLSGSSCRVNRWQQCLAYNDEAAGKSAGKKVSEEQKKNKCNENSDCFVKNVDLIKEKGDTFKFDVCLPKYPSGFDLETNGDGASSLCNIASQQCKVIYVKDVNGWKCSANCRCETAEFTQQMNDFCMSIGDCGMKVNYAGDLTINYQVKKASKIGKNSKYVQEIKKYFEKVLGQKAEVGNLSEFAGALGIPTTGPSLPGQPSQMASVIIGVSGLAGASLPYLAAKGMLPVSLMQPGQFADPVTGIIPSTGALSATGNMFSMGLSALAVAASLYSLYQTFNSDGPLLLGNVITGVIGLGASGAILASSILVKMGAAALFAPGIGLMIGAAAILVALAMKFIFKVGETKEVIVSFTCKPWQAPDGGAKCGECGKNGLPCSKYACDVLGQNCEFINEGSGEEMCVDSNPNDVNPPAISPLQEALNEGYRYDEFNNGFNVLGSEGCVKAYDKVGLGVKVDEPAQCRIAIEHSEFDEMDAFGNGDLFAYNHTMEFVIPSLESLGVSGYDPNRQADMTFYVRCKDKNGNVNVNDYLIKMCVKPGEDKTAARITGKEPVSGFLKFGATEQEVSVFTNEPAECRWDSTDKEYDLMTGIFSCKNGFAEQELKGWRCKTTLPISQEESTFYARCKDQPWLAGVNESKRNANSESYAIVLKRSTSQLSIDSITPNNETKKSGTAVVSVDLEAETSGGYDGSARCAFSFDKADYVDFIDTLGSSHKQPFESFTTGRKIIYVRCEDFVGNVAEGTADFTIEQDIQTPRVTRVYGAGGSLVVITDENAECAYDRNACAFEFSSGILMSGNELRHETGMTTGENYYIKCRDSFGNANSGCSIIVRAV